MQASKELLKNEKKKLLNDLYKALPLILKISSQYEKQYTNIDIYKDILNSWLMFCDLTNAIEDDIKNDK